MGLTASSWAGPSCPAASAGGSAGASPSAAAGRQERLRRCRQPCDGVPGRPLQPGPCWGPALSCCRQAGRYEALQATMPQGAQPSSPAGASAVTAPTAFAGRPSPSYPGESSAGSLPSAAADIPSEVMQASRDASTPAALNIRRSFCWSLSLSCGSQAGQPSKSFSTKAHWSAGAADEASTSCGRCLCLRTCRGSPAGQHKV